jgi:hypothetical protein
MVPALSVGGVHDGVVRVSEMHQVCSVLLRPYKVLLHTLAHTHIWGSIRRNFLKIRMAYRSGGFGKQG